MRLGSPTANVPPNTANTRSKYADIYKAVGVLKGDDWLPVQFDSERDALNFRVAASLYRRVSLEVRLRGHFVYVRQLKGRSVKNGSKGKR